MKKVIAITPNPSVDISGWVQEIKPNEKTYVHGEVHSPGGNSINAGQILHRLGVPVVLTGFLGGATGREVQEQLNKIKIKNHFVEIKGVTRINITVSNKQDHQQTRLSFAGPEILKSEVDQLERLILSEKSVSCLLIGGSLPPGFTVKNIQRLIAISKKRNSEVVIDCPGKILKKLKSTNVLLIKPNLEEFQELTNSKARSLTAVIKEANKLLKWSRFVCVSSVEGGAVLITKSGSYFGRVPKIKINSTVGAGDSMVGAMIARLLESSDDPADILRWGLAAAAATLNEKGMVLGDKNKIERFYKKIAVKSV